MGTPLRVLLVTRHAAEAERLLSQLRHAGYEPDGVRVETEAEYLAQLDARLDVILMEHVVADLTVGAVLQHLRERNRKTPLLVIAQTLHAEAAIDYLREGAADYIHTDRLERLGPAVARALEQQRLLREKEQERAARAESERALSTLLANLPGVAYRCHNDREWTMEFVSEGCRELTGYAATDLTGNRAVSFQQLIHPEDRKNVWQQVQAAVAERQPFQITYRITTAGGEERWVWEQGRGVYSKEGRLLALEGFITDVTQRMQAENALREYGRQWQATFNAIGDAVALLDHRSRIVQCNRAMRELFGLQTGGMLGKCCFEVFHQQDHRVASCPLARMLRSKSRESEDIPWRDRWFRVTVDPVTDEQGRIVGAVHIARDVTERRQAEESQRQLAAIVEASRDAIFSTTLDGAVLSWNAGAERIYGYRAEEIVGKSASILVPPEHRAELVENLRWIFEGHQVPPFDTERLRKDGRRIDVSVCISPITDASGAVLAASVIARDITDQKRDQAQIRFRASLLAQVRNAVVATDMAGRVTYWNRHAERLLQWRAEEVIGKSAVELLLTESGASFTTQVWNVLQWGDEWDGETVLRRRDGSVVPVHMVIGSFGDGSERAAGWVGVITDITARKQAEQSLRESEARYRGLYEAVEAGIVVQDREGVITHVNEIAEEILGLARDEATGRGFTASHSQAIHEDGSPFPAETHPSALVLRHGETIRNVTMGIVSPDQRLRWLLVNAAPIYEREGDEILGVVATLVDITDRKRLEEGLRQSQKMEAVGRLAGGVAHDFNNLLMSIMTYSGFLVDRLPPGELLRFAEQISQTAERAAALPRQLLAFSRKQMLQPKVVNLNTIVAEMERLLARVLGEDIQLVNRPDAALGQVKADPAQIEQVLMNLAVNARDAMPEGGQLTIETANVDLNEQYVRFRPGLQPGRYVLLVISDTGCGMDKETQSRIFEPFFTTKEKGKGTGLGLAIVYGAVKQSGGEIRVYSEPGKGTTFRIYLPRVDEAVEAPEEPRAVAATPAGSETVLLVEDDEGVRAGVAEILSMLGYRVLQAGCGEDACTLNDGYNEPIHLLLTDVVMPGMNGRELAERLAALRPQMKIVFMSGYTENAVVEHAAFGERIASIQKPFTPTTLARKLRDVLDGR